MFPNKFLLVLVFFVLSSVSNLYAQNTESIFSKNKNIILERVEYTINWNTLTIDTYMDFRWLPNTTEQYINPSKANKLSQIKSPQILAELSNRILIYNQNTLLDYAREHLAYQKILTYLLKNTSIYSQIPNKNLLGTTITLQTSLTNLIQELIIPNLNHLRLPVIPYSQNIATAYTSIIFSVSSPLPLISKLELPNNVMFYEPKALPKVFSEQRDIMVFTPEYFNPKNSENTRAYNYIYIQDYQYANTGNNPLLIVPKALDSNFGGDLIISKEDTQIILESNSNKDLIRKGKVFFIIPLPTMQEFSQ